MCFRLVFMEFGCASVLSLWSLDVLPSCPELRSGIRLPLDSMEVVDDVEDLLKDETNFKALVSLHWLKLTDCNRDAKL